jgi:prefoldin subunit 5
MADVLAKSSNLLNQSLENLRQEIEALKQQMQTSSNSGQMVTIQNSINELYKYVGELRSKVEK